MEAATNDFHLYEALLWEPSKGYFLLEGHELRLQQSAAHFGFLLDRDRTLQELRDYSLRLGPHARKVRLELARSGALTLEDQPVKPSTPVVAALASAPVDSADEFLRHKTSRRQVFDRALAAHPDAADVILWNERRELTESCFGNIVVEIDGQKLTPPLSSGLLPGVFRAHLLEQGEMKECVLPLGALEQAAKVFLINSVRRWCELKLLAAR